VLQGRRKPLFASVDAMRGSLVGKVALRGVQASCQLVWCGGVR
jgi:hypothetical protein